MTRADFAARCGVTKKDQICFEKGRRSPSASYLSRAQEAGIDVLYVLSGWRAKSFISPAEAVLLEAYRSASKTMRRAALAALLAGRTAEVEIKIKGDVGAVVRGNARFGEINIGGKSGK